MTLKEFKTAFSIRFKLFFMLYVLGMIGLFVYTLIVPIERKNYKIQLYQKYYGDQTLVGTYFTNDTVNTIARLSTEYPKTTYNIVVTKNIKVNSNQSIIH